MSRRFVYPTLFTSIFIALASPSYAAVDRLEVEGIIKDYLQKNPEVVVDALKKYDEQQRSKQESKAADFIAKNQDALFKAKGDPVAGNTKDADVSVAIFFDYHCGYCKHLLPEIVKLLENDKKVRIVFKEFPILGEDSAVASRAALAVAQLKPESYFAYHQALMQLKGTFTQALLVAEAKKLGIDEKKFTEAMNSKPVNDIISSNHEIAQKIGIGGTPALIVGSKFLPGYVAYDKLKEVVDAARAGKK